MSTSNPISSAAEQMKRQFDKFVHDREKEMEKVVSDRDSLKEKVERLRWKKRKYKARVHELERRICKAEALLSGCDGTQSIPPLSNNKRKRDADKSEVKEAASGVAITIGKDNQYQTPQTSATARRQTDDSTIKEEAGHSYYSGKQNADESEVKEAASGVAITTGKDNQSQTPQINATGRRQVDDSTTTEAAGHSYSPGKRNADDPEIKESVYGVAITTEKDNQVKTPQISATCRRKKADGSATKDAAAGHAYNSGVGESSEQYVHGLASHCIPIINKIKDNLSQENLENFEQSCFGHLLKIDKLKFQGQLLLQLLMHLDMSASNTKRLVFKINNSITEFGLREFCLITGLRLGTSEEAAAIPTSSSSMQGNVFMGSSRIMLKDIEERFLVLRVGPCGDELTYNLALLYFLYGVLFAENPTKQIDQQYLPLVDKLEDFYAFPWGRVAYEFLASSLLLARSQIDGSNFSLYKRKAIRVHGFSFALQVWAYEVMMPSLTQHCAVRVCNVDVRIPRILHWSSLNAIVFGRDIEKFFTSGDEAHLVLPGIRASPWELEALTCGTIPQPKRGKSPADKDKEVSRAARPTSSENAPVHHPACVSRQADTTVVKAEMQTSAAGGFVIISDSDDDDAAASPSSQSVDSDYASFSEI